LQPDWVRVGDETVALLQRLIQFDTRNPPGNELPLARFLVSTFESAGIPVQLFEPTPGRGQVVARLSGSGARRPVMLLAHMDVVGVEAEMWTCDPFAGVARDGFLYGRGAIDDKGMLAANVITMLQLKKHVDAGGSFSRDVVFVATADEEAGGECGMAWLVQHHPEVLDAEFALNEGGRTRIIPGGGKYLAVQTSEKISHVVELSVKGTAGHAAIPLPDNAIFALGRALALLADHREPVVLTPTTRSFFRDLARVWPDRDVARGDAGSRW
jgi:Acetylornithine deacetylase/Succinyl-diaminopimelate desuccinylase and related deacylases